MATDLRAENGNIEGILVLIRHSLCKAVAALDIFGGDGALAKASKKQIAALRRFLSACGRDVGSASLTEIGRTVLDLIKGGAKPASFDNLKAMRRVKRYANRAARGLGAPSFNSQPRRSNGGKPKSRYHEFYKSAEWKRVRYQALKASDGRCELCGMSKHDGAVLCVDHIVPLSEDWSLRLDLTNLQVLCGGCNWGKGAWDDTDWRAPNGGAQLRKILGEVI